MSGANRCGFFATVHDRKAAGCTADIDEANYQEYSTYFFAALRGKTRTGTPITPPDYDGDGRVSPLRGPCLRGADVDDDRHSGENVGRVFAARAAPWRRTSRAPRAKSRPNRC